MSQPTLRSPDLLRKLAERIREFESGRPASAASVIPLDMAALDDLLPDGGLPAGSLVELLSAADGTGAWSLALLLARQAAGRQKALVAADRSGCFYPPAAAKLGVDLRRTIVVRPSTQRDVFAALDLSLRCTAVGAVLSWCDRIPPSEFRRFQLAAEAGAGLGLLLRGPAAVRTPSFAAARLLVTPVPLTTSRQCHVVRVEVLRRRGGKAGQSLIVEIDRETADVRVPAEVAVAAAGTRAARASG